MPIFESIFEDYFKVNALSWTNKASAYYAHNMSMNLIAISNIDLESLKFQTQLKSSLAPRSGLILDGLETIFRGS